MDPDLTGCDLLVSAQTGSGKTLGFGLAISPTLLRDQDRFDAAATPLALVIAPTRELALQVKRELGWLYAQAGAIVTSCVGGMDMRDERRALARGAHIVVATPGRLRDHIMRETIDLANLRAVVLDEADEMLDLGFREDLEFILEQAPTDRQTLLFSATVPKSIAHLAKNYQRDAIRVVAKSETAQHADIDYRVMTVAERDTENAVINTLRYYEAPNAIVFGNTRAMVNRLTTRLSNRGFQVVALSGELSQAERSHALQAMRDGRAQVCVATDVAARGIDLPNLDLVVHAELPSNHETLLHRSGRTGRAGRKGVSALIVTRKSRKKAERILRSAKLNVDWTDAPSADSVRARDDQRMFADPNWQVPVVETEQNSVEQLTSSFTVEQIATAYLRLYRAMRSAPEELSSADSKPTQDFGPSIWFSISGGRDANAEPRRLLPMLCKAGNVNRDEIGAIRVRKDLSYVEIKESSVPAFLAAIGPDLILEAGSKLTQLPEPPDLSNPERAFSKPAPKSQAKPAHRGKHGSDKDAPKPRRSTQTRDKDAKQPAFKPTSPRRSAGAETETADRKQGGKEPPRRKSDKGRTDRPAKSGTKPKGPPPPVGKPTSKKNKARALTAKRNAKRTRS